MTMTLIETKTLTGTQATIEFTSIPQDATDLVVLASLRTIRTGDTLDVLTLGFNGSTTSRSSTELLGDGATNLYVTNYTNGRIGVINSADSTSNTFSNYAIYIPNYTAAVNKTASVDGNMEHNASRAFTNIFQFLWSNTSAITSLTLGTLIDSYATGSTVSLYKVTKGSSGGVTVS